jgi:predicted nucleotidyltransferase component of viral defense system
MQNLKLHEIFEMEVLDYMNSTRLLTPLIFGGGTMLRLCYELNRYSVDLDFYFKEPVNDKTEAYYAKCLEAFTKRYMVADQQNKYHTYLIELKHVQYPNRLKIEINKDTTHGNYKQVIAFSKHSQLQVLVNTIPLDIMMENKIAAFIDRLEIRDVFDIEFLYRRGISLPNDTDVLKNLVSGIKKLSSNDYSVKLSSILSPEFRTYYTSSKFEFLLQGIQSKISG